MVEFGGYAPECIDYAVCTVSYSPPFLKESLVKEGYPSVARLACEQHFWAVKNLVRRRQIKPEEFALPHNGKTALEWVRKHGQEDLVKELMYFFPVSSAVVRRSSSFLGIRGSSYRLMFIPHPAPNVPNKNWSIPMV
jgi:hypothetical protein